ncbi:MAG: Hpt domain protein [Lentisphaerae bacterium ADurb.Bin242]|nr:MAG: Hpt domain protein [Lentisphaerae bacterium ADurb.Bin242]
MKDLIREYVKLNLGIDDNETFELLYENYLETVADCIGKIEKALNEKNAVELRYAAHALKGCSANIGAEDIRRASYDIEMAAKNENLELCTTPFEEVKGLQKRL